MTKQIALLSGFVIAAGLALAIPGAASAAPAQSTLPALHSLKDPGPVTQVRRRCWRTCVRRKLGVCYRWRRHCRG